MNDKHNAVVWWSALYDLLVTWPFATPWTAAWVMGQLTALHHALSLDGSPPTLESPLALLFMTLMGSVVTVWSLVRLRAPTVEHGRADSLARALFSAWMIYALAHGGSWVVAPFLIAEVSWGLVQLAAVAPWRPRKA